MNTEMVLSLLERNSTGNIVPSYAQLLNQCQKLLNVMADMAVPGVKLRWFENSDAGPGVGVSNFEVKFRDAELTMLYDRDYACRIHSARGSSQSSGDNETERLGQIGLLVTALWMARPYSGANTHVFLISVIMRLLS